MTAPTVAGSGVATGTTRPFVIAPGAGPVPISDGHNSPVGMTLLNRGDSGGTVLVQPGPTGQAAALPLGPAATLTWTDPANLPFAALAPGAGQPETLLLTSQSSNYANPTVVAAATAASIAAQGVTLSFSSTTLYDATLAAGASITLTVGGFASLSLWAAHPFTAAASCVTLQWQEPRQSTPPAAGPWLGVPPVVWTGSAAAGYAAGTSLLQFPVSASQVVLTNTGGVALPLTVAGTNRAIPSYALSGDSEVRAGRRLVASRAINNATATNADLGCTRYSGNVSLQLDTPGSAVSNFTASAYVVDRTGAQVNTASFTGTLTASSQTFGPWPHPVLPVRWSVNTATSTSVIALLTVSPA